MGVVGGCDEDYALGGKLGDRLLGICRRQTEAALPSTCHGDLWFAIRYHEACELA